MLLQQVYKICPVIYHVLMVSHFKSSEDQYQMKMLKRDSPYVARHTRYMEQSPPIKVTPGAEERI